MILDYLRDAALVFFGLVLLTIAANSAEKEQREELVIQATRAPAVHQVLTTSLPPVPIRGCAYSPPGCVFCWQHADDTMLVHCPIYFPSIQP